jgi:flagellar basal body-associated protein FliL
MIIQFMFINVPSQQPDGQLQKRHTIIIIIIIIIIIVVVVVVLSLIHLSNRNVLQKFRNLPDSTIANR